MRSGLYLSREREIGWKSRVNFSKDFLDDIPKIETKLLVFVPGISVMAGKDK